MAIEIDIKVQRKEFLLQMEMKSTERRIGILGASGCGKSMTLKSISGIEQPFDGKIVIEENIFFDSKAKINLTPQQRKIGYLFQNYALFPTMTVEDNIVIGVKEKSKKEKKQIVEQLLQQFHLEGLQKRYPDELSGGQQQRVALARIMAYEPQLILLDEPFSALDSFLKESMKQEMKEFLNDYKGNMILVSHSRDEIYEFCDWLIVMEKGRVIESGKTKKIFEKPRHVTTAKLTGCKNISAIEKIDEHTCYAIDWKIRLTVKDVIDEQDKYIGFRAHDMERIFEEDRNNLSLQEENIFASRIKNYSDAPFEITYVLEEMEEFSQKEFLRKDFLKKESHMLSLNDKTTIEDTNHGVLWYKVGKRKLEIAESIHDRMYFKIPSEKIFLMKDVT